MPSHLIQSVLGHMSPLIRKQWGLLLKAFPRSQGSLLVSTVKLEVFLAVINMNSVMLGKRATYESITAITFSRFQIYDVIISSKTIFKLKNQNFSVQYEFSQGKTALGQKSFLLKSYSCNFFFVWVLRYWKTDKKTSFIRSLQINMLCEPSLS